MESIKVSIITATYNRAKFLTRLYESIINNLNNNVWVEWLIMDDGSTDETKKIISDFKQYDNLEIGYNYQKNSGKMNAINNLIGKAKGDLIVECDSDDYFAPNAFEIIAEAYLKYKDEKNIYGLCFLKNDSNGNNMGKNFKNLKTTMFDLYFKEGENGEKAIVFISDIRKKYKHKLEQKEKFVTEARLYHEMDLQYNMICINKVIMICQYQEEGYTKNIDKQFRENPYGYFEYFKEILNRNMNGVKFNKRLYAIKHYILFGYLTNRHNRKDIRGIKNKILYSVLYVPRNV